MTNSAAILLSLLHVVTFVLYNLNYARLRKNAGYSVDRKSIYEMPLARKITKIAFAFSFVVVLASFWVAPETPGFAEVPVELRFFGLALTFVGFLFLRKALDQLGPNYSPVFDVHRPLFIVREGLYKKIRHPVYLCNMIIILGYVLASSTVWVLPSAVWGWGYMISSILREEKDLAAEFADYRDYQNRTWRIIPYVF